MNNNLKLKLVKLVHTLIWLVMAVASLYILYCGVTKSESWWLWVSIALLGIESLVLIFNNWTCPLTPIAMKYTEDRSANFGIYLPKIIAEYNKVIFGIIFVVGLLLVIYNHFT